MGHFVFTVVNRFKMLSPNNKLNLRNLTIDFYFIDAFTQCANAIFILVMCALDDVMLHDFVTVWI